MMQGVKEHEISNFVVANYILSNYIFSQASIVISYSILTNTLEFSNPYTAFNVLTQQLKENVTLGYFNKKLHENLNNETLFLLNSTSNMIELLTDNPYKNPDQSPDPTLETSIFDYFLKDDGYYYLISIFIGIIVACYIIYVRSNMDNIVSLSLSKILMTLILGIVNFCSVILSIINEFEAEEYHIALSLVFTIFIYFIIFFDKRYFICRK